MYKLEFESVWIFYLNSISFYCCSTTVSAQNDLSRSVEESKKKQNEYARTDCYWHYSPSNKRLKNGEESNFDFNSLREC